MRFTVYVAAEPFYLNCFECGGPILTEDDEETTLNARRTGLCLKCSRRLARQLMDKILTVKRTPVEVRTV